MIKDNNQSIFLKRAIYCLSFSVFLLGIVLFIFVLNTNFVYAQAGVDPSLNPLAVDSFYEFI